MTIEATIDGQVVHWRDSKRYLWIMGAIMPLLPFAMWGLFALSGSTAAWFFGPFFVYVLIPVFDLMAGLDPNNPPDEVIESLEEDRYYRWITYRSSRCSWSDSSGVPTCSAAARCPASRTR